jgi:hypothetical protein
MRHGNAGARSGRKYRGFSSRERREKHFNTEFTESAEECRKHLGA